LVNSLDKPLVSVIVPTFRRPRVLRETLIALLGLDYPSDRYEIIVIDDGSADETGDVVRDLNRNEPRLLYYVQENRGVAAARNRGARMAGGEILIFIDDDIIVQPTLITQHIDTMKEFGDCLVNGHWEFTPDLAAGLAETPFGRFRTKVEQWVKTGISMMPLGGKCFEPSGVTACNLGVRRDTFWSIGGFDEQFPFAGCEDQELSLRAAAAGCRFVYNSELICWHHDQRMTLREFCERQRRGAVSAALLALKYSEICAGRPLTIENREVRLADGVRIIVKKLIKRALITRPVLELGHRVTTVLEDRSPDSRLLPRLYWMVCGLYIFAGFREGLARFRSSLSARPAPLATNKAAEVSVVIPAYNAEQFLSRAVTSALQQTLRPVEVLVVDDGSNDRTAAIAEGFGLPVRCVRQRNGGVSRARNAGIAEATGTYVAFLDADDVWEPAKLEKQVAQLEANPNAGLCFTAAFRVDNELAVTETIAAGDYADYCEALLLYSCVVTGSCSSAVARRELVVSLAGFDPSFSQCADWDFWLRLSQITSFVVVDEPLVRYVCSPTSMSSDIRLLERDTFGVLDKFFRSDLCSKYLHLRDRCYSNHWMILSGSYLHAGSVRDSMRCLVNGVRLYPRNIIRVLGMPGRWLSRRSWWLGSMSLKESR
jgi:glycosyltransferase involved in cell wall biosynthesis